MKRLNLIFLIALTIFYVAIAIWDKTNLRYDINGSFGNSFQIIYSFAIKPIFLAMSFFIGILYLRHEKQYELIAILLIGITAFGIFRFILSPFGFYFLNGYWRYPHIWF